METCILYLTWLMKKKHCRYTQACISTITWNYIFVTVHTLIVLAIFACIRVFLQSCRLGQHRPISKGYPDGIVLVGGNGAKTLMDQPVSDWFLKAASGNSDAFTKLKLYAQVCRHNLGRCLLQPSVQLHFLIHHHPWFFCCSIPCSVSSLLLSFHLWHHLV